MQHLFTFITLLFVFHSKSTKCIFIAESRRCRVSSVQNVVAVECCRCRMLSLQNVMSRCKLISMMSLWCVVENQWSLCVNDESVMSRWRFGDETVMKRWWVGDESVMSRYLFRNSWISRYQGRIVPLTYYDELVISRW